MAKLIFRNPEDPPKKVLTKKLERKKKLLFYCWILQTVLTIGYIVYELQH